MRQAIAPSLVQKESGKNSAITGVPSREGLVYVHCTAGLGRAPAVCIAYMYWFLDMSLDEAYQRLTEIRPCGPKVREGLGYFCQMECDVISKCNHCII